MTAGAPGTPSDELPPGGLPPDESPPDWPAPGGSSTDEALRLLGRLRFRASVRKQLRRLRTPRGWILALLGTALFVLWFGSIFSWSGFAERGAHEAADLRPTLRVGSLFLFALAIFGALQHRGLYLPHEEIERLFSAPLSRAAITRYRLRAAIMRTLFGAVLMGLLVTRRAPVPAFGFAGTLCALASVTVVGQCVSILAGALERKLGSLLHGVLRAFFLLFAVFAVVLFWGVFLSRGKDAELPSALAPFRDWLPEGGLPALVDVGAVRWLSLPFEPWVRTISSETTLEFWTWFPLSLGLLFGLFELTARLPMDYRELSLETAASVAERLRRMRRVGGGASASEVTRGTRSMRVPFLFGRSPAGALAWRKSIEILRKARGTLWVSCLVLLLLLFISGLVSDGTNQASEMTRAVLPSIVLASMGIVYLCSGLRFDFRDDLDRMATIRSWPLAPSAVFVATLLPEFVLVSVLLWVAVALRLVLVGAFHPAVFAVVAAIPPAVFAWLALDNLVFLFAPVRFVPGQEGALQNAGRLVVIVFLRVIGASAVLAVTGLAGAGALFSVHALGGSETLGWVATVGVGLVVLVGLDVLLAVLGGVCYRRFDVARDRG